MILLNPQAGKMSKKQLSLESVFARRGCYEDMSNKVAREYTADLRLSLYMESTTVFMPVVSLYFVVFICGLVRRAKKVGGL